MAWSSARNSSCVFEASRGVGTVYVAGRSIGGALYVRGYISTVCTTESLSQHCMGLKTT